MSKEGWFVGLEQEEVAWGLGKYLKYLKSGSNKKARGERDFKKGLKGWVP